MNIQEQPYEPLTVLDIFGDFQESPFVLDILHSSIGIEEGPNDVFIFEPNPDAVDIDAGYAQEPGQIGFDVDAICAEFSANFDEIEGSEDGSDIMTDKEVFLRSSVKRSVVDYHFRKLSLAQ